MKNNTKKNTLDLLHQQSYNIVKSNDLIQKRRFDLTLAEQKIILRLIQMIQPTDDIFREYEFDIQEYCEICGLDKTNGKNYENIKISIDRLSDKKFWLLTDERTQTISQCRWITKPKIVKNKGLIKLSLDEDLRPYLLNLKNNFTVYSYYNILPMQSKYSPRLYEIIKSHQYKKSFSYGVDELQQLLNAEAYIKFCNFNQKVLAVAIKEINKNTDIFVSVDFEKKKKKVIKINFSVRQKTTQENLNILLDKKKSL